MCSSEIRVQGEGRRCSLLGRLKIQSNFNKMQKWSRKKKGLYSVEQVQDVAFRENSSDTNAGQRANDKGHFCRKWMETTCSR